MLSNCRVLFSLVSAIVALILTLFFDGILSNHLIEIGVPSNLVGKSIFHYANLLFIGYLFGLVALVYALSSPLIGFLAREFPTRYITQSSFLIAFIALLFLGPSKLLNLPYGNIPMTIAGLSLCGITTATVFVPLLSDIINTLEESEDMSGRNLAINDKASALFNTAGAIGTIIGPIIGGVLNDGIGFESTCDTLALTSLGFAILYFFIAILPSCLKAKTPKIDVAND